MVGYKTGKKYTKTLSIIKSYDPITCALYDDANFFTTGGIEMIPINIKASKGANSSVKTS